MSCLCSRRGLTEDNTPLILDVEEILKDYAWDNFVQSHNKIQRLCLRRSNFNLHVPLNYFHFENFRQRVSPRTRPEAGPDGHILDQKNSSNAANENSTVSKSKIGKGATKNSNIVEISTDFVNDTDTEQTYKFRLEKTRKAILSVTFQKGFTVGGRAKFSVELPKLAQFGTETDMTINVTKQEGENIEETIVLETTSDIKVSERSKYVAKVILAETKVSYDFAVWCRLSMPMGGAPVSISRKKDGEICYSITIKRLDKIFERYKNQVKIKTAPSEFETENYVVEMKIMGIIEGVRLSDQRIILESSKIKRSSKHENDGEDGKGTAEKTLINVDYVPQPTATHPSFASSSLSRPRSIDGPIIEEVAESDDEVGEKNVPSTRSQPRAPTNRGSIPKGAIPAIVATSPGSAGSSPISEKSGSHVSISSNTTTTV